MNNEVGCKRPINAEIARMLRRRFPNNLTSNTIVCKQFMGPGKFLLTEIYEEVKRGCLYLVDGPFGVPTVALAGKNYPHAVERRVILDSMSVSKAILLMMDIPII